MPDDLVPHANSGEELKAWNTPAMDVLYDQILHAADVPALDPVDLIPATPLAPLAEIPAPDAALAPDTPVVDTPAPNEAEAALATANTATLARVQALGGLDEIEIMAAIAQPFMEGEVSTLDALDAIEKARGPVVVGDFAREVVEAHWASVIRDVVGREGEMIVNSLLLTPAELAALDPQAKAQAESIRTKNPDLTQKVANFRAGNGLVLGGRTLLAVPTQVPSVLAGGVPTNGVAHPAVAALPKIDAKDYDGDIEKYVQASEALAAYTGTLEAQVKDLQSQVAEIKTTTVKSASDVQREAEAGARDRIYVEVDAVVVNLLRSLSFSTETDPVKAEKENGDIKQDIGHLAGTKFLAAVSRDRGNDGKPAPNTPGEQFDRARAAIARKDSMGRQVRKDLQDLKKLMNGIVVEILPRFNGRAVAAKKEAETPVTPPPTRVDVSGPGSGAAPLLPESSNGPQGGAWETSSMLRQYNQKVAQRSGQRPV